MTDLADIEEAVERVEEYFEKIIMLFDKPERISVVCCAIWRALMFAYRYYGVPEETVDKFYPIAKLHYYHKANPENMLKSFGGKEGPN